MPVVFCSFELHFPTGHSLKKKRTFLRKTTDYLRSWFNFSISEIEHQDLWQRGRLGAVSIGPNPGELEKIYRKRVRETERILDRDLVRREIAIFEHD